MNIKFPINICIHDKNKECPLIHKNNKVILIIGKSGSGKDSIAKEIKELNKNDMNDPACPCKKIQMDGVKQYTNRPKRVGETDDNYIFITDEHELESIISNTKIFDIRKYSTLKADSTSDVWYYINNTEEIDLNQKSYIVIGPSTNPLEWVKNFIINFGSKNIILVYVDTPNNDVFEYAYNREVLKSSDNKNYSELARRYLDSVAEFGSVDMRYDKFVQKYDLDNIHYINSRCDDREFHNRCKLIYEKLKSYIWK